MRRLAFALGLVVSASLADGAPVTFGGASTVTLGSATTSATETSDPIPLAGPPLAYAVQCPAYAPPPTNGIVTVQILDSLDGLTYEPVDGGYCTASVLDGGLDAGCIARVFGNPSSLAKAQVSLASDGGGMVLGRCAYGTSER